LRLPLGGPQCEVSPIPLAQYGHAPLVWQADYADAMTVRANRWQQHLSTECAGECACQTILVGDGL
jgi:hypothetical protein